jgi:ankyrin repeat protein
VNLFFRINYIEFYFFLVYYNRMKRFLVLFLLPFSLFAQESQEEKNAALLKALERREIKQAQELLVRGADPNARDEDGNTAAHKAARLQYGTEAETILPLLESAGCRFDVINNYGESPLSVIGWVGRYAFWFVLEWELKNSPGFSGSYSVRKDYIAHIFIKSSGSSGAEAVRQTIRLIDTLAASGESFDGKDEKGRTIVGYASGLSNKEIVQGLMDKGLRFDIVDDNGVSPLFHALERETSFPRMEIFTMIFNWEQRHSPAFCGSKASRKEYLSSALPRLCTIRWDDDAAETIRSVIKAGADWRALTYTDESNPSELLCIEDINLSCVLMLTEAGMPVNIRDKKGETFLSRAVDDGSRRVEPLILTLLTREAANPNIADNEGKTALMKTWRPEIIKLLLQYGADPKIADNDGNTAMHRYLSDTGLRPLYVQAGADVNAVNNRGWTPLMNAARRDSDKLVMELLDLGADPMLKTPDGKNLLLIYMEGREKYAKPGTVKLLLDLGIDPSETDDNGNSALRVAFVLDDAEIKNMFSEASDKKAVAAAKRAADNEKTKDFFKYEMPFYLYLAAPFLISAAYVGFSIGAREGIYRNNPDANFMNTANAFIAGFALGGYLSALPFLVIASTGDWSALFGVYIVPVVAVITGALFAVNPEIVSGIKDNPVYYYGSSVLSLGITIPMFRWRF